MNEPQVLVEVTRGPLVENLHRGHAAVVDNSGKLLYSYGDPRFLTYWRSSAKPVQALPVVESGAAERYSITDRELSLFCASHNGEANHTDSVLAVLGKTGLDLAALQCGMHMPLHKQTTEEMIAAKQEANPLHSNCSGKHSGMLALACHREFELGTYTELENPLQQLILDYIADLTGYPREEILIGIDGCGVPVHGLPLFNMALAYARMVAPAGMSAPRAAACRRVSKAMYTYPEMVGGTDRFCTDLMRATGGKLIAKGGAGGVYCVGVYESGFGIAVKCEDGFGKARDAALVEILRQLGVLDAAELEALAAYHKPVNKNHRGDICGEYRPVIKLKKEE